MAKKNKVRLIKTDTFEENFINVPTYLFPQSDEFSKDVVPTMDLQEDEELENEDE